MKFPTPLPIDTRLPEILDQIRRSPITLIQSPPGTGKTVHLPIAALELGPVWVLEPRRVAARLAAGFAASESTRPETVGYQFRNENHTSAQTRLTYLTEGMLLRRASSDPLLRSVTTVILDEFHERHQQTDLAWAYLRHLQNTTRPDLKLVLLSATLDVHKLKSQVPDLSPLQLAVPSHPLTLEHRPEFSLAHAVKHAEHWLTAQKISGSILIFLPGSREIDQARRELESQTHLPIFSLVGSLPFAEQERITRPQGAGAKPRIILSTNLTESSVTIDGVRAVIDVGSYRQANASPWSGIPKLTTRSITQASAIQRAGRAARQGPGLALRLYSEAQYRQFLPFETPEILRSDLSPTLLTLAGLEVADAVSLPWLDPPPLQTWQLARQELMDLGFFPSGDHPKTQLTQDGMLAQRLPATPRIARMVLDAARCPNAKQRDELLTLAAQIATDALPPHEVDPQQSHTLSFATRSEKQRLQSEVEHLQKHPTLKNSTDLLSSTLHAWSDRVALRQGAAGQSTLWLAASGQELFLPTTQHTSSPWIIALDVLESQRGAPTGGGSKPLIRSWMAIQEEDLLLAPSELWQEENTLEWDSDRQSFWQYARTRFGQITLSEKKRSAEPSPVLGQALYDKWLKLAQAHPEALAELESCIERLKLARILPNDAIHPINALALDPEWLGFEQIRSLKDAPDLLAKDQDLALSIALYLDPAAGMRKLEQAAPRYIQFPKRRGKILYRPGQVPEVESRLQDFLGMRETPRVGQPAQPLKLILLAPNFRPLQVTQDLASFWKNTYPTLRRELMRRYPRHAWPENPLENRDE